MNQVMNPTGVKSMTVSGAAQTANATDLFLIVLRFSDTSVHGNESIGMTPSQNIDTPLDAPAGGKRRVSMSLVNLGVGDCGSRRMRRFSPNLHRDRLIERG